MVWCGMACVRGLNCHKQREMITTSLLADSLGVQTTKCRARIDGLTLPFYTTISHQLKYG